MKWTIALLVSLPWCGICDAGEPTPQDSGLRARVADVLATTPLVDGHNDLMIHYHACREGCPRGVDAYDIGGKVDGQTDLARWKAGGVGAQLLNAGWLDSDTSVDGTLKGLDFARGLATRWPDQLAMATTAADVRAVHAQGKLALVLALEHPERIGTTQAQVDRLSAAGLRSEILAYNEPTALADGHAGPAKHGGLSPLGAQVVGWMEQAGILVDLSHASADTARDVLEMATAPVIFSHSNARALTDVSRNVPDDVLRRVTKNGGVVMATFVPEFTSKQFADYYDAGDVFWAALLAKHQGDRAKAGPDMDVWEKAHPRPVVTIGRVADHIEHIRDVAGIDHVGIGGDFDGIDFTVTGLEDVSTYPALLVELARRGWSDQDLAKLAGENFLRVLAAADARRAAHLGAAP